MRRSWRRLGFWVLILTGTQLTGCATSAYAAEDLARYRGRVEILLAQHPLIDGHNDVPWQYRLRVDNKVADLPFGEDTKTLEPPMHTDIPRMRQGMVGGQFWSVYVPSRLKGAEAVKTTMEQIDIVHQMVDRYPDDLALAETATDIVRIHREGKIASLVGMEGGHSIGNSLGVLRTMYAAGARYMTLTHWSNTEWADAATDTPEHGGLTSFGRQVVQEMNRLGMMVDLSHVSAETMRAALDVSEAPVFCSHSGAAAVNPHPRNVPDDVLKRIAEGGGLVMVDFLPAYVSGASWKHGAERQAVKARLNSLHLGDPTKAKAGLQAWDDKNPAPKVDADEVIKHIDHIRDLVGVDFIGLGSDFDGMGSTPVGLEDVSTYPDLLARLLARGYSEDDVRKIAGGNLLRMMRMVEETSRRLQGQPSSAGR
ncbi:MAG: dipeptidase [Myxococcota bacterium]|nr:dipeptidase [Myxococcota bacterium]